MRPLVLLLVLVVPLSAQADEVELVRKPTIARVGDGFEVSFAVSQLTDVEVAILDKENRVVRHLAAGVIGQDAEPPPPFKMGRSQDLVWDGKDDHRKPAGRGPFTVRVRAGLTPTLGRIIANPAEINPSPHYNRLFGLATDQSGQLYVASGSVYSGTPVFAIKVYDRQGRYVKTIMPMPANLKPDEVEQFGAAALRDGFLAPANHHPLVPYVQPGGIVAFLRASTLSPFSSRTAPRRSTTASKTASSAHSAVGAAVFASTATDSSTWAPMVFLRVAQSTERAACTWLMSSTIALCAWTRCMRRRQTSMCRWVNESDLSISLSKATGGFRTPTRIFRAKYSCCG